MHTKKLIGVLQSFVVFPMFAMTMPLASLNAVGSVTANTDLLASEVSVITTQEDESRQAKADAIDDYFASKGAPLSGYGMKFVEEAEENDIDWRLLPAIAMRETTGGKFACKSAKAPNNNFGWHSCKSGFSSVEASIEYISKTLGGNNDNVLHYHSEMTTEQILKKYNPDSIIPGYSKQVMKIMDSIEVFRKDNTA
ncbi:MAG: hypothetical protein EOM85_02200 [Candidatus Moranbacteria bacterium]|nr:hypothetical protein [Candidatus Moranbacteria bacterium]